MILKNPKGNAPAAETGHWKVGKDGELRVTEYIFGMRTKIVQYMFFFPHCYYTV